MSPDQPQSRPKPDFNPIARQLVEHEFWCRYLRGVLLKRAALLMHRSVMQSAKGDVQKATRDAAAGQEILELVRGVYRDAQVEFNSELTLEAHFIPRP